MTVRLSTLLSFNAGYVDTAGFLLLHGLFTAHVTGNFVMLGDALVNGSDGGIIVKLLALPVFCLTVLLMQFIALCVAAKPQRELKAVLLAEVLFLSLGAVSAITFRHFTNPEGLPLILTGMLMVAGMAIQNAAHKVHLASAPPTTLMTGTTTQVMLDLGSLLSITTDNRETLKPRLKRLITTLMTFAAGCAIAAVLVMLAGTWALIVPPLIVFSGFLLQSIKPTVPTDRLNAFY